MHHLPTEMRIFIMEYLTLESKPIEPGKRLSRYHLNRDIIRNALQNTFTGSENEHHFDWKYMEYMTPGIAATWFQTTTFHFDDSLALNLYFRNIWLGCQSLPSIVPADHLRHMTVQLRGDMRDYNRKKQECTGYSVPSLSRSVRPTAVFCEHLEFILKMKRLYGFSIHVMIATQH
jgi:hypothetical protein